MNRINKIVNLCLNFNTNVFICLENKIMINLFLTTINANSKAFQFITTSVRHICKWKIKMATHLSVSIEVAALARL